MYWRFCPCTVQLVICRIDTTEANWTGIFSQWFFPCTQHYNNNNKGAWSSVGKSLSGATSGANLGGSSKYANEQKLQRPKPIENIVRFQLHHKQVFMNQYPSVFIPGIRERSTYHVPSDISLVTDASYLEMSYTCLHLFGKFVASLSGTIEIAQVRTGLYSASTTVITPSYPYNSQNTFLSLQL